MHKKEKGTPMQVASWGEESFISHLHYLLFSGSSAAPVPLSFCPDWDKQLDEKYFAERTGLHSCINLTK